MTIENKTQLHHIFCLMGKSASGKDTVYGYIMSHRKELSLENVLPVVMYTTRPIRSNEINGRDYHFVSDAFLQEQENSIIEKRTYPTMHGEWTYAILDDDTTDLSLHDYLVIETPEGTNSLVNRYGEAVVPIMLAVDDGERLQRALDRERTQEFPRYAEMCRRFLSDEQDFEGILCRTIANRDFFTSVAEIADYIKSFADRDNA